MFILNKKTGMVQECHNNDAIKACRKDTDHYAVSERREDLVKEYGKSAPDKANKGPEGSEAGASPLKTEKTASEDIEGTSEGKSRDDEGRQQEAGENAGMLDVEGLKAMNVSSLKNVAKDKGIQGYANMNKETLIAMILNH